MIKRKHILTVVSIFVAGTLGTALACDSGSEWKHPERHSADAAKSRYALDLTPRRIAAQLSTTELATRYAAKNPRSEAAYTTEDKLWARNTVDELQNQDAPQRTFTAEENTRLTGSMKNLLNRVEALRQRAGNR